MQEAIPYRTYHHASSGRGNDGIGIGGCNTTDVKTVSKTVSENAVVMFGRRGCCMSHVVKTLLLGHGVNPAVFEVEEIDEANVVSELLRINDRKGEDSGGGIQFPAVFVGGELFGGLDQVMAAHISGELVPILKGAGALWL
ncbi:hypothetical protein LWI28_009726 [Acer negundo]|uniref:Glutaredoxin domain-containing protein n=1 Tax=Acer negundo TaxID=4023 RepID=A0AAD5P2Y7_ACENE|nr:hypothetical protein LWI28_009726 [Acer negundo]KAK4857885.1 hypothetical protein QYF36_007656 [Acer negundo]